VLPVRGGSCDVGFTVRRFVSELKQDAYRSKQISLSKSDWWRQLKDVPNLKHRNFVESFRETKD
jgi:hypothetical protein